METLSNKSCAVIVAHPDDESLWAGGLILANPDNHWNIITTCRKYDPDRSSKFSDVTQILKAEYCEMGDIDDSPEQTPLNIKDLAREILALLPKREFDIIITHSVEGEYTRHLRHEEVAQAVIMLIELEKIKTKTLMMFAYEDAGRTRQPLAIKHADVIYKVPDNIWQKKYEIITDVYGFSDDSWEAKATPKNEAFWRFHSIYGIKEWIHERSK